jgi:cell division protein FtsB
VTATTTAGGAGRHAVRTARRNGNRQRRRRLLWPALLAVTVIGIVFIGVYPTRTWLGQRHSLDEAGHQLQVLQQQNDALSSQIAALNTDSEIERLARERYNLVRPGEESYAINPAPPPPIAVPSVWPFTDLAAELATTPPG